MKKNVVIILVVVLAVIAILGLAFTMNNNKDKDPESSLAEIETKLYEGIPEEDMPSIVPRPLTDEELEGALGLKELEFEDGIISEPMINAIPHSVVLVKVKDGVDVEKTKADIKANVNPRKWICVEVEPENVFVESRGNVILLIMTNTEPLKIKENFAKIK